MRADVLLTVGLLLCSVGVAVSDSMSRVSQRQDNCTQEQLDVFDNSLDPMCGRKISRLFEQVEGTLYIRLFFPDPPLPNTTAIKQLIEEACTDTCVGLYKDLFMECTPTEEQGFESVEGLSDDFDFLCGTNGDDYCPLQLAMNLTDDQALNTALLCLSKWQNTLTCNSTCRYAFDRVIEDVGCCAHALSDFRLTDSVALTAESFFSDCDIRDPGACSTTDGGIVTTDGGIVTTATIGLSLLAALIGTAVNMP